jgi:biotin carboxyl carrier protein
MKDLIEVEPGVWSLLDGAADGNDVYEIRLAGDQALVNGHPIQVVLDDAPSGARRTTPGAATGPVQIKATMPGKVVRVLVEVGESVAAGQGVIVIEAMKMQNELKSPRDGRITHIAAQEHATVNAGDPLVTIE